MSEEAVYNIIANTFTDFKDNASAVTNMMYPTFNPIDKIVELYNEKIELYERMLKAEQEKNALLEKLLNEK